MSGSGSDFVKMKTQCGGDRPASGNVVPNKEIDFKKVKLNKKKVGNLKKSNLRNQKVSVYEKIVDENVKSASANHKNSASKFGNSVKKACEQNLSDNKNNFELMSKLNEHGIEGYMLNGRG